MNLEMTLIAIDFPSAQWRNIRDDLVRKLITHFSPPPSRPTSINGYQWAFREIDELQGGGCYL